MSKESVSEFVTLEIETREITIERANGETNTFKAYKTFTKTGKKMDVKFTREVKPVPEENCYIKVHVDNMNVDRNRKFPVLWIREIEEFQGQPEQTKTPEDYKELRDMFGGSDDTPF